MEKRQLDEKEKTKNFRSFWKSTFTNEKKK